MDALTKRTYLNIEYTIQTHLQDELPEHIKRKILSEVEYIAAHYKGLYEENLKNTVQFNSLMIALRQAGVYKGWIKE